MIDSENPIQAAIRNAEEYRDPLDELVEKSKCDPDFPFLPDILTLLATLRQENRGRFDTLRKRLKVVGVPIFQLDRAVKERTEKSQSVAQTQIDRLLLFIEDCKFFRTPSGECYVDVSIENLRHTWPVRSDDFSNWLAFRYFETTAGAPASHAMKSALAVAEAKARFLGPVHDVFLRVAHCDSRHYLDLADADHNVVEIDDKGWRIRRDVDVRFRRPQGMLPLPIPRADGSIELLREFINVPTDDDFILIVSWLAYSLLPQTTYPLLVVSGEQGSAKSTFTKIMRALIDPNSAPTRPLPRDERELYISAGNAHVLAFDNISSPPAWVSDALSRMATGGGYAARKLYSDRGESLFDGSRPMILNGIENPITRADLADRAIFLRLEAISDARRRAEKEFWATFMSLLPSILGGLLDVLVVGVQDLPTVEDDALSRMADFAQFGTACEKALASAGAFRAAYRRNRSEAIDDVIESDDVASAVMALALKKREWKGTATDLLNEFDVFVDEKIRRKKFWPITPRALSGRLHRARTFLRSKGVEIDFRREGHANVRTVVICMKEPPTASSASSAIPQNPEEQGSNHKNDPRQLDFFD